MFGVHSCDFYQSCQFGFLKFRFKKSGFLRNCLAYEFFLYLNQNLDLFWIYRRSFYLDNLTEQYQTKNIKEENC